MNSAISRYTHMIYRFISFVPPENNLSVRGIWGYWEWQLFKFVLITRWHALYQYTLLLSNEVPFLKCWVCLKNEQKARKYLFNIIIIPDLGYGKLF